MAVPTFTIVETFGDEGPQDFLINGELIGSTSYNAHGSQGMSDMRDMFEAIADKVGAELEIRDGSTDEDDDD